MGSHGWVLFVWLVLSSDQPLAFQPKLLSQRHATSCQFENMSKSQDRVQKIMYNQQSRQREAMRYQVIASEACGSLARRMEEVRGYFAALLRSSQSYYALTKSPLFSGLPRPIYLPSNYVGKIS